MAKGIRFRPGYRAAPRPPYGEAALQQGDPRLVRLGYSATAPLRYGLMTAGTLLLTVHNPVATTALKMTAGTLLLTVHNPVATTALKQRRQQPIGQIVAQDAAFITYLLDLANEARMLLADLG